MGNVMRSLRCMVGRPPHNVTLSPLIIPVVCLRKQCVGVFEHILMLLMLAVFIARQTEQHLLVS